MDDFIVDSSSKRQGTQRFKGFHLPGLVNPKSAYQGHIPELPVSEEKHILLDILVSLTFCRSFIIARLTELKAESTTEGEDENCHESSTFIEADLEDFSIYLPHNYTNRGPKDLEEKILSNELTSLHGIYQRGDRLRYMDGILSFGGKRRYVQRVPFDTLSIGGYADQGLHTVGSEIWIQSLRGRKLDVWYRLRAPASEYRRYHEPFLWVADLAKHVIDYMTDHENVSIFAFRSDFFNWLREVHGSSDVFRIWHSKYNDADFRRVIACHSGFLYYQAMQLDQKYALHPVWAETDPEALDAIPKRHKRENPRSSSSAPTISKTVVTTYVFQCFKHLPFAKFLDPQTPAPHVLRLWNQNLAANGFDPSLAKVSIPREQENELDAGFAKPTRVSIGDVIAINSDKQSNWKHNDHLWYGYVQGTQEMKKGMSLKIIWLYRPTDTACQQMKYPHPNELFISDHCNCNDGRIYASEVMSKPKVSFFAGPDTDADFFVRQKYIGEDAAWVTLQQSDFECSCKTDSMSLQYSAGDTLLVKTPPTGSHQMLEAVEVIDKAPHDNEDHLHVRRLRKARDCGQKSAEPNELMYTDIFEVIAVKDVVRACHVRFFTAEDKLHRRIPCQYSRGGTGDFYYIIHHHPWPRSMKEGWDPTTEVESSPPVMKGLDIFCGGGNLGRGLEEGGAVEFKYAVDYFKEAIHTYRANLTRPDKTDLFYGSVNDYLNLAMSGDPSVAQLDGVQVISAGSPCQGFSNANQWRENDGALLNVSMVASVVAFVDFYRPKYALLENVTGMAKCNAKDRDGNVFAQVLGALVGMGYQARSFILDSWSFGSPQSRTRLFISIAAPGLVPLSNPPQTHSHPESVSSRSLGKSANGLTFANRCWDVTPFSYVTIGEATKDLPLNHDGRIDCIPFPDHRPSRTMTTVNRVRTSCIPRFPPGMNFVKASLLGLMPPPQMEAFNWNAAKRIRPEGRAWKRVNQNGLIPTVITKCQPDDGLCGAWIHWDASRCMTVMEVRRAQGFPDEEVILGVPNSQWKIVGNSVARPVAFALGMELRGAWLKNAVPLANQLAAGKKASPRMPQDVVDLTELESDESDIEMLQKLPSQPKPCMRSMVSANTSGSDDLTFISSLKRVRSLSPICHLDNSYGERQRQRHNIQPIDTVVGSSSERDSSMDLLQELQSTARTVRSMAQNAIYIR